MNYKHRKRLAELEEVFKTEITDEEISVVFHGILSSWDLSSKEKCISFKVVSVGRPMYLKNQDRINEMGWLLTTEIRKFLKSLHLDIGGNLKVYSIAFDSYREALIMNFSFPTPKDYPWSVPIIIDRKTDNHVLKNGKMVNEPVVEKKIVREKTASFYQAHAYLYREKGRPRRPNSIHDFFY